MNALWDGSIQELFFLFLRLMAALGGALFGWFVSGPLVALMTRMVFLRRMPGWAMPWCRLIGAIAVGLLVFWLVPIGGLGGGGGGRGGGTGPGRGPDKNGIGTAKSGTAGKGTGTDKSAGIAKGGVKKVLEVEVLGPTTVQGDKGYLIGRKVAANWEGVKAYIVEHKDEISSITIVVTKTSVTEFHAPVQRLTALARELEIPHLIRQE